MDPLTPALLYIRPLAAQDAEAAGAFSCGDDDLDDFLRTDAMRLQQARVVVTFVALYESQLIGYVALLADAVRLKTPERKKLTLHHDDPPFVPALKIARVGVRTDFKGQRVGHALVAYAYFKAIDVSRRIGCRLLTVDAYPAALGFYERLGFVRNQHKTYDGKAHPSMRLDLFSRETPDWISDGDDPAGPTGGEGP